MIPENNVMISLNPWKKNSLAPWKYFSFAFHILKINSASHLLMDSFKVFKYVNLILWKEKYILGRIGFYFGGFGEKLN